MLFRCLIAAAAVFFINASTTMALAPAKWAKYTDPTKEISLSLPAPVKASKTASGSDEFEGDDGDITYSISFRRRSTLPADREMQIFCDTFAKAFERVMAEKKQPVTISLAGQVNGKNWQGRIYHYKNASGFPGAFEIAIGEHHNFVLHVIGGAGSDEATKTFFSSLTVN